MKKFLLILLLVLVVVVGVVFFFLDKVIKTAVLTVGPQVLGTKVELKEVNISLISGGFTLEGLRIANPEGYTQTVPLVAIDNLQVSVAPFSLLSDTIVVKKFVLKGAQFSFEQRGMFGGKSNLTTLTDNINKYTGAEKKAAQATPQTPTTTPEKKVILHYVRVEGAKATILISGASATVDIPTIEFNDIGVKEGGVTPAQAAALITEQITARVGAIALNAVKDGALKVGNDALKGAGDAGNKAVEGAGNVIKGLFK